jgi:preprotein translocase subunit SecE
LEPDATTPSQTTPASGPVTIDDAPAPVVEAEAGFTAATMAELRRVVWPSRQQLFSESVAVILMVSLSAAAIAAVDRFYGWAAAQVFG